MYILLGWQRKRISILRGWYVVTDKTSPIKDGDGVLNLYTEKFEAFEPDELKAGLVVGDYSCVIRKSSNPADFSSKPVIVEPDFPQIDISAIG